MVDGGLREWLAAAGSVLDAYDTSMKGASDARYEVGREDLGLEALHDVVAEVEKLAYVAGGGRLVVD